MPSATAELPPLGLYIHLPWCVRKCPYCDFNSHALRGALPVDAYVRALLRDAEAEAAGVHGREISSVFIGGGTPSLFPAEMAIGRAARRAAPARGRGGRRGVPTLEADPGTGEKTGTPSRAYG
ncbi:MAG: hypothetical protein U5L11_15460 [Arhodomonas sp.]|nr:hypothetical protein [Arhodomonas sp.]